jgi:peptidoglycan hydrolase-like protein with peptidoglycan-binding domain
MKATLWLGATALAAALAAGPALAAGDSAKQGMQQQGAAAGASASQMQHDQSTVRQAQERLNQLGYDAGAPDGIWGPQTEAALKQYQEKQGLTPSGELDQRTIAELGLDSVGDGVAAGASSTADKPGMADKPGAADDPSKADKPGAADDPSKADKPGAADKAN